MRLFQLNRKVDVSGVSGTGIVAHGVDFGEYTVLYWIPAMTRLHVAGLGIYHSLEEVERIHGHDGRTVLEPINFVR